eukprot:jgi/Ulvmu1/7149/UM034_0056.1
MSTAGSRAGSTSPGLSPPLTRVRHKDARLRDRFRLPDTETCIDYFACAYSSRILRQGHIYVMLGHVCFHSTVAATVLTIKTNSIESIAPKSNLLFPNSIEIIETDGTRHFFTSFLSRERCLDLIMSRWQTEKARHGEDDIAPAATPTIRPPASSAMLGSGTIHIAETVHFTSSSLMRKGWPVRDVPPPDAAGLGEGWVVVLDQVLQGWEVADVLKIFDSQDSFFNDWHWSLGDTDVDIPQWRLDPKGDRVREIAFTARIHDPPLGAGRTARCVATQEGRMHPDGIFSLDVCQSMPQLTIASFRVDFLWRIAQQPHSTHVLVHMRVRFLRPSLLRATISSQSVSQGISCYTQLKQRLVLRFPPQGAAAETHRPHSGADVGFALRIAKEAACRMPQRWQDHLLSSLSTHQAAMPSAFMDITRWWRTALPLLILALLVSSTLPRHTHAWSTPLHSLAMCSNSTAGSTWPCTGALDANGALLHACVQQLPGGAPAASCSAASAAAAAAAWLQGQLLILRAACRRALYHIGMGIAHLGGPHEPEGSTQHVWSRMNRSGSAWAPCAARAVADWEASETGAQAGAGPGCAQDEAPHAFGHEHGAEKPWWAGSGHDTDQDVQRAVVEQRLKELLALVQKQQPPAVTLSHSHGELKAGVVTVKVGEEHDLDERIQIA